MGFNDIILVWGIIYEEIKNDKFAPFFMATG